MSTLYIDNLSECASASTAAPSFIAGGLLRLLSRRTIEYAAWISLLENSLHKLVASSLQVLCIYCKFLASSLQVLCKFLAKFLAKSLQEFSAGGGKRWKTEPIMAPTSIQNGANLAQGVGKGYSKINKNMKNRRNANANTNNIVLRFCYVRRFPQKTEGSTAGRLPMFYEQKKNDKNVV